MTPACRSGLKLFVGLKASIPWSARCLSMCASAYVSIRQHASAYFSIRPLVRKVLVYVCECMWVYAWGVLCVCLWIVCAFVSTAERVTRLVLLRFRGFAGDWDALRRDLLGCRQRDLPHRYLFRSNHTRELHWRELHLWDMTHSCWHLSTHTRSQHKIIWALLLQHWRLKFCAALTEVVKEFKSLIRQNKVCVCVCVCVCARVCVCVCVCFTCGCR